MTGATNGFVVADHFLNDKAEEFLGKIRIQLGGFGQPPQTGDLLGLTFGIGCRKAMGGLKLAHRLRTFEALGQQVNERRVDIVDRFAQALQFWIALHVGPFPSAQPLS